MANERSRFVRGEDARGMAYPIQKGREGYWPRRIASALRRSSIINILGTQPGERVMEPEFGSDLPKLIFEPNDDLLMQAIIRETAEALAKWDPFLEVVGIAPEVDGDQVKIFIDFIDKREKGQEPKRQIFSFRRV
jgi:phage baseplate assembly protein W